MSTPSQLDTPHDQNLPTPTQEFWHGAQQTIPLLVGAAPFGILFGTIAQTSGLSFTAAIAMSTFVFAGASQFIALGLLASATPIPIIILTTWVVNLRHLLYSVAVLPHLQSLSQFWRAALGFWLTDETFMVAIKHYNSEFLSPHKHWFHLGSALAMYLNWQLCTFIGLTVGQSIPSASEWGLEFAVVATFIGMTVPYLKNRPGLATVLVAGTVSLLTRSLPHQLGLMVAAISGMLVGVLIEDHFSPKTLPSKDAATP